MRTKSLLAVVAIAAAACGSGASAGTTTLPKVDTTTTTAVTTTTLPATPSGIAIYGLDQVDGEPAIFVLNPETGEVSAVLVEWLELSEGAGDLFFDASANLLYFSRVITACSSEIVAVDPSTGDLVSVASGSTPVVSPDGRYLAYAIDPICQRQHDIHVRDLTEGTERVWVSEVSDSSDLLAAVTRLSWSPDSSMLAIEVLLEDGSEIRVLDVTTAGGEIFGGTRLMPDDGAAWTAPLFLNDGSLLVAESCCGVSPAAFRLVTVDPITTEANLVVDLETPARPLDEHPTGDGILVATYPSPDSAQLWRYLDGKMEFVADGLIDAVMDAVWLARHPSPILTFEDPRPLPAPVEEQSSEELADNRIRVWPASAPVEQGVPYRMPVYTHCGLDYLFDFDGSFWEVQIGPENGHNYLDNLEDTGVVTLNTEDEATYISSRGGEFRLGRTEGPREVDLCE